MESLAPRWVPKRPFRKSKKLITKLFAVTPTGRGKNGGKSHTTVLEAASLSRKKKTGLREKKQGASSYLPLLLGRNGISSHVAVRFFSLVLLIDYTVKIFNVALGIDSFIDREKDLSEIFKELSCSFKWEPLKKVAKNTF